MKTFLEFIEKRSKRMVTEAFNDKDVNKMLELVEFLHQRMLNRTQIQDSFHHISCEDLE